MGRRAFQSWLRAPLARPRRLHAGIALLALCRLALPAPAWPAVGLPMLTVDAELGADGRNYDDMCFWRHPTDPDASLVFVTSKDGGLVEAFELATGRLVGTIRGFGRPNNCDVFGNWLVTTDDSGKRLYVHSIPDLRQVTVLPVSYGPQGVAIARENGRTLSFISDKSMDIRVYELPGLQLVRQMPTALAPQEAVAVDEFHRRVFVTRDEGADGVVHALSTTGTFLAEFGLREIETDGEGIAIYRCGTQGWILVSDQQLKLPRTEYEIFDRITFAHIGAFTLATANGDVTTDSDGIDLFQTPTSRFPTGVFAACDKCTGTANEVDLVSWDRIASTFGLAVCPEGRPPLCGNGAVNPPEEQCDGAADAACPGHCASDCTCGTAPSSSTTSTMPPSTTTTTLANPRVEEIIPLGPIPGATTTAEKPQSKLWRHDGTWWAVLPSAGVTPAGTWIWRLEPDHTWTNVLRIASSTAAKADAKAIGNVAHILLHSKTPTLVSVEYSAADHTYVPWPERPMPTPMSLPDSETATIDVDSTGRLWLATESGPRVVVYYSDPPYRSFGSPITLADDLGPDDITVITALPDRSIGVLWSNQTARRFGFRRHEDGADPRAASWSADEKPASQSGLAVAGGMADDHLNLAVAPDGTLYAVVKTSYNRVGFPEVALLVRRPNGSWDDLYEVTDHGTRPTVVLDEAGRLRVAYTTTDGGGSIVSQTSATSPIAFGPPEPLISGFLDNATSTRAIGDGEVVILAGDGTSAQGVLIASRTVPSSTSTTTTTSPTTTTTTTTTTTSSTTTSTTTTTSSTTSTTSTTSTSTTTLPRPPLVLALAPAADTYIESGSQATWAHGGATQMHVDDVPWDVTYLKFDLSAVVTTVHSAVLRLRCTNHSEDGGTIYPVADSSWIEGTATGSSSGNSAGRPGLKWNDVDTNRDGTLSAADSSPFVPDFTAPIAALGEVGAGNTVEVDVTGAFQSGPGFYTLALRSRRINNRATYVSREHSSTLQRPVLVLTVGP